MAYAFGAYLSRNYGGPELFRHIVQNGYGDSRAIEEAMTQMGYDENLTTLLPRWGAACLLSNRTSAPSKYRYNRNAYFDYTLDGQEYPVGSINLWNYQYSPGVVTSSPSSGSLGKYNTSNLFYYDGLYSDTTIRKTFTMPADGRLTVIVK